MTSYAEILRLLTPHPGLTVQAHALLSGYTRFGLGGPADLFVDASQELSFTSALDAVRSANLSYTVIGGGSNLVVSDRGFRGVVLRYSGSRIDAATGSVEVAAGANLQDLVNLTVNEGLRGLETMTGIPGSVGGAVYGNAGAYGHSIMERVVNVRFFDGTDVLTLDNSQCEFRYRESIFKRRKDWIIFSTRLALDPAASEELRRTADGILEVRNAKYPPSMKCAGSIFKNLILAELAPQVRDAVPEKVIREGKVPSAYFLEEVGAKGMKLGDVHVADYHANLIYNAGAGTAQEVRDIIAILKRRVREKFGLELEEEVQFIGFEDVPGTPR